MVKLYDIVKLDEEYAKESGFPSGLMIVAAIYENPKRHDLRLIGDTSVGVFMTENEDKIKVVCSTTEAVKTPFGYGLEEQIDRSENQTKKETPKTVNILGTDYTVVEKPIKDCDGYCDKTTKEIAVAVKEDDCDLGNFEEHRKKVLRHEVIHAYHFESGLAENFENKQYGFSETLVDWFAYQSPKIFKTFEELGIL